MILATESELEVFHHPHIAVLIPVVKGQMPAVLRGKASATPTVTAGAAAAFSQRCRFSLEIQI